MGNSLCCEQVPIHKEEIVQIDVVTNPKQKIQVPLLPEPVQAHLEKHKPFQNQLAKDLQVKKFGTQVYEGEVDEMGRPNGFGKMYYLNGSVFLGKFDSGMAIEKGHYIMADGSFYHGKMSNNKANDTNGYFQANDFQYTGSIVDNIFEGEGQQKGQNYEFKGTYENHKKKYGTFTWTDENGKNEYIGGFDQNGKFYGKGELKQEGIGLYKGEFKDGKKHGQGEFIKNNGMTYVGEYKNGVREGKGKIINRNKSVPYDGEWKNGLPNGKGMALDKYGEMKEREWIDGVDKSSF